MDYKNTIKRKKTGMRKAVVAILFLCITAIAGEKMPAGTVQAETRKSGDYRYEVNDVGTTLRITKYTGSATTLTIPSTLDGKKVTAIGESAFEDCGSLTSITIPDGVMTIGREAFEDCTSLANITIPGSVTTIGGEAFEDCTSLKKITIPAKVTSIGKEAFYGCKNLKSITIKTTKLTSKKIGNKAFKGIPAKATIKVPKKKLADYKKILKKKGVGSQVKIKKCRKS